MALLSIVLPAYNEEQNIANTAKVLGDLLDANGIDYELVFISDGSKDGTFERIQECAAQNPRVRGAEFSRNFGKEAGIFAGLELTTGDAVIVMDCDLQHPPEVIPLMWEKWQQGAEIVEGIKSDRGRESLGYKLSAGLFYKIMSKLIKMDMNASSDFKLLDRKVVQVLLELPERNTFFRALTFWAGFKTETVEYEVQERKYGQSKWSFWSLMKYAITNATSFSTLPLQLVTIMGMISISGHRRIFAAEKLGYRKVPTIIRYMTDDQAVIAMVDSNLQRERIQPSEKAFAYKMKYDVLKRKSGRRKAGQVDHNSGKKGLEIISEETGDSPKQVQRYIKMADLIPELLEKVDDGSMGFTPAVQIAYLKKKEQKDVLDAMELTLCTPSLSQAMRMKKLSADGKLTPQKVEDILSEIKQKETDRVVFKNDQLHKYFPKNYSTEQMKREIIELLKLYVMNY